MGRKTFVRGPPTHQPIALDDGGGRTEGVQNLRRYYTARLYPGGVKGSWRRLLWRVLADALEGVEVPLGFLVAQRVLDAFAVAAQEDGIEDGQRTADAPQEADAQADESGGAEGDHGRTLPFARALDCDGEAV